MSGVTEQDRFAAVMGSHPRPILLFDEARLAGANDAACVFFGFSEQAESFGDDEGVLRCHRQGGYFLEKPAGLFGR